MRITWLGILRMSCRMVAEFSACDEPIAGEDFICDTE